MSYSALVLTEPSREHLLEKLKSILNYFPESWEVIAHHMTIEFPATSCPNEGLAGVVFPVAFAVDEKVCAVKLATRGAAEHSKNDIPHITVAVNREAGGKPFMSNKLTNWVDIPEFMLVGVYSVCK